MAGAGPSAAASDTRVHGFHEGKGAKMKGRSDFAGGWILRREIRDRLNGAVGHFTGHATLVETGLSRLDYDEGGMLQMGPGLPLQATRRYVWVFDAAGVAVTFADGTPFHRFVPGVTGNGTDHFCAADLYKMHYDFDAWPHWQVSWRVTGPRKDYEMVSFYSR
jgi:hypothetical protein